MQLPLIVNNIVERVSWLASCSIVDKQKPRKQKWKYNNTNCL